MSEPGMCKDCERFRTPELARLRGRCLRRVNPDIPAYTWDDAWCPDFKRKPSPARLAAEEIARLGEFDANGATKIEMIIEKHCGKGES